MKSLSIPHEHGGYLTSIGAALAAVGVAPAPLAAAGVGLAVVATFFARGAVDRMAVKKPLARYDVPALALLAAAALAGAWLVGRHAPPWGAATLGLCATMLVGSVLAQRARRQRHALFEALGMGALGATAGFGAFAAGATWVAAATAAIAVATHTMVAVPLVRTELRPRERALGGRALVVGGLALLAAAAAIALLGHPLAALALAPRALHVADRAIRNPKPMKAAGIGIRETTALALCVGIVVWALRW